MSEKYQRVTPTLHPTGRRCPACGTGTAQLCHYLVSQPLLMKKFLITVRVKKMYYWQGNFNKVCARKLTSGCWPKKITHQEYFQVQTDPFGLTNHSQQCCSINLIKKLIKPKQLSKINTILELKFINACFCVLVST